MHQKIQFLREKPYSNDISMGYVPDSCAAEKLYESLGFKKTGENLHGEVITRLTC